MHELYEVGLVLKLMVKLAFIGFTKNLFVGVIVLFPADNI